MYEDSTVNLLTAYNSLSCTLSVLWKLYAKNYSFIYGTSCHCLLSTNSPQFLMSNYSFGDVDGSVMDVRNSFFMSNCSWTVMCLL